MLSKDAVGAMREKHPNYMPFNRYFDEEEWVKDSAEEKDLLINQSCESV